MRRALYAVVLAIGLAFSPLSANVAVADPCYPPMNIC